MNFLRESNLDSDRGEIGPTGGFSSILMFKSYSQCGASVSALAFEKTSANSWYNLGTPFILDPSDPEDAVTARLNLIKSSRRS